MSMGKRTLPSRVAALGLAAASLSTTMTARADDVSPTGKGITGGALLGGEVITIPMALAGVHAGWPYAVFGALGAVGGGVGGWAVEQSSANGQADAYMLAGGLALVIPALVLTLNATRYQPSDSATEDHPPADMPAADPGTARGSVVAPAPPPPPPPTTLLDVHTGHGPRDVDGFRLGVPVPQVRSMYTPKEQATLGVPQKPEVRVPVLSVSF